jgi:ribose/xylose/arabinose/galactoside ABC-type transport system permease subunit
MNLAKVKILLAKNGAIVALLLLVAVFTVLNPRFVQPANLTTIVLSMAEIGIIAIPLAFLVMSGSIDLSVGSVASLGSVICGLVSTVTGNIWLGILVGAAAGLVTGLITGILVEHLRLNPLVVTLGLLNVWAGLALFLTNGRTITGLPAESRGIAGFSLFGVVPLPMLLLLAVTVVSWFVLNHRPFGRQLLAAGGNERAAFLMGINVRSVRLRLFVLAGVAASFAGALMTLKLQAGAPTTGSGLEFSALTVVLLGGVAVAGGAGRISGVIAGLLFVGVLRNGLVILGVSQFLQTMIVGLTLVVAISLDETLQRVLKSAWNNLAKQRAAERLETTATESAQTEVIRT